MGLIRTFCSRVLSQSTMAVNEIPSVLSKISKNEVPWGSIFCPQMVTMSWTQSSGWTPPQIEEYGSIVLDPSASVFHYGMEVFEGMKAYKSHNGAVRLFRPELNLRRLNKSAKRMALPTVDEEGLLNVMKEFVAGQKEWVPKLEQGALYIRPFIIATEERIGVKRSEMAKLFVIATPVGSFFTNESSGVKLLADERYMRAWEGGVGDVKTGGNYAMSIMPAEEAKTKGYDQILWLGKEGKVTEAGMMNVFFVFKEGGDMKIVTPKLDGLILDGVVRRSVIEIAKEGGWKVEERDVGIEEVKECVEVFGTGTGGGICKVEEIGGGDGVVWKGEGVGVREKLKGKLMGIWGGEGHHWMVDVGGDDKIEEKDEVVSAVA